jgi:SAM-dependent methyltransferase
MASSLENVISTYNEKAAKAPAGTNIEFELRFKNIDLRTFNDIGAKLSDISDKPPTLQCTINVINDNLYERKGDSSGTTYIRTMYFTKGVKTREVYSSKAKLIRPYSPQNSGGGVPQYAINISEERDVAQFAANPAALVRLKLRLEYVIGSWRFDVTAVKQTRMSQIGKQLINVKNQLFTEKLSADNFYSNIPHDMIDRYEIEAEWIGNGKKLSVGDVEAAIKIIEESVRGSITGGADAEYQNMIYNIATKIVNNKYILPKFKSDFGLKRLLNQVVALSKNTYRELYPPKGYLLTDKADGIRACAWYQTSGQLCVLADKLYYYEAAEGSICDHEIILDCELLLGEIPTLLVFDCMYFDGSITHMGYSQRILKIPEAISALNGVTGITITAKNIVTIGDNLQECFDSVYKAADRAYHIDGLILSEPDKEYSRTHNYKWKPTEQNTIDFLAVKCPSNLLGKDHYMTKTDKELYLLFVGINHEMRQKLNLSLIQDYRKLFDPPGEYYPVQFSPSIDKYAYLYYYDGDIDINYKVIELRKEIIDGKIGDWKFVRVRTDRSQETNYYGNDFKVAELTYMNYINPFDYADLITPSNDYFAYTSADTYMAANRYKRFVISLLIKNNLSGAKWVIDLAAGRGADLHRYQEVGVHNTLFIDIDRAAIVELIRRKFDMFSTKRRRMQKWGTTTAEAAHAMTVHTMVRDLKTNYKELTADTDKFVVPATCDGIVCNFAIHYFCDNIQNLRNLLQYIHSMLRVGGVFIFTTLNGNKVFEKLASVQKDGQYEINDTESDNAQSGEHDTETSVEPSGAKYIIKKLYSSNKMAPCGQNIAVRLPFTDELREEPLANIEAIVAECERMGMELELNEPFDVYLRQFEAADRTLYSKLSSGDINYIGLHQFVSVRKVK